MRQDDASPIHLLGCPSGPDAQCLPADDGVGVSRQLLQTQNQPESHGWGGAGGCPWTREPVFSWLNRGPFPLGGRRVRRWASVGSVPGTSYEM